MSELSAVESNHLLGRKKALIHIRLMKYSINMYVLGWTWSERITTKF